MTINTTNALQPLKLTVSGLGTLDIGSDYEVSNGSGIFAGKKVFSFTAANGEQIVGPVSQIVSAVYPNPDAFSLAEQRQQEQLARNDEHFCWQSYSESREQFDTLLAIQSGKCAKCHARIGAAPAIFGHVFEGQVLCQTKANRGCSPFAARIGRP